ncbi:MAG TPA: O-methyltransferase [Candidatus Limnocylindrales bacterium]
MTRSPALPVDRDLAYIEAAAAPLHPVLLAIEAAAAPADIPILDRASGRVLATLAVDRPRIVELGTAYGYSTLWMALAQPHRGMIVTVDPDAGRTQLARAWWREAGIEDERINVVNRPALEALADEEELLLQGPFDLAFLDAVKTEYLDYFEALMPRLATGALLVADNVLWGGRVAADADDPASVALRAFAARVLADRRFSATILPVGDGLLVAALRS